MLSFWRQPERRNSYKPKRTEQNTEGSVCVCVYVCTRVRVCECVCNGGGAQAGVFSEQWGKRPMKV